MLQWHIAAAHQQPPTHPTPTQAVVLTAEHRVYGRSAAVQTEVQRVEAGGGWVRDGRVCDILGVSRTFGDRDFKGEGLARLLQYGVKCV